MMSRQLKLSATLSVLAMALFALVGTHGAHRDAGFALPHAGESASVPALPALGTLLPTLR